MIILERVSCCTKISGDCNCWPFSLVVKMKNWNTVDLFHWSLIWKAETLAWVHFSGFCLLACSVSLSVSPWAVCEARNVLVAGRWVMVTGVLLLGRVVIAHGSGGKPLVALVGLPASWVVVGCVGVGATMGSSAGLACAPSSLPFSSCGNALSTGLLWW